MIIPIETDKGSTWRKWDLHIHSVHSRETRAKLQVRDIFERAVDEGISVISITDHTNVDGLDEALKVQEEEFVRDGHTYKFKDYVRFIPGIELKTNRGNKPVHITALFPLSVTIEGHKFEVNTDFIQRELLDKINCSKVDIMVAGKGVYERGLFEKAVDFINAISRIHELSGLVIIHSGSKDNGIEKGMTHAKDQDNEEELLNSLGGEKELLMTNCINICELSNWNEQNLKNRDFYLAKFNKSSIVASDSHESFDGKKYTWIKADCTFEGLKQIIYEPMHRVHLGEVAPVEPLYKISRVTFDFPPESTLGSDEFCLNCVKTLHFSPYFNCIIGGRGTGKSSVLNLIHEKLKPGQNTFFKEHSLNIPDGKKISNCIMVDDDDDEKFVEFLSQNEIEIFAKEQKFTYAIYFRLKKLDADNRLESRENESNKYLDEIDLQIQRIDNQGALTDKLNSLKKELQTSKKIVDSFRNEEYLELRRKLQDISVEIESLKKSKARFAELISKIAMIARENSIEGFRVNNIYDKQFVEVVKLLQNALRFERVAMFSNTELLELKLEENLREAISEMDTYLRRAGVSVENSKDVSAAHEKIASLESQVAVTLDTLNRLKEHIAEFSLKPHLAKSFEDEIKRLLDSVNKQLKEIAGTTEEVKQIELVYDFNMENVLDDLAGLMATTLSDDKIKIRQDFMKNCLTLIDLREIESFSDIKKALELNGNGKVQAQLLEYLSSPVNFEIFKLRVNRFLSNIESYKEIKVYYDQKPLSNSSFGQRCTAAIVILLLLGNTPIIIDEPEAHLDSSLIAKYLVELIKKQKNQRQIIFATHNANFVVNGDAELIHILTMDDKTTQVYSTTIENLEYRNRLLMLEGGQLAFEKRERRYNS